LPQGAGYPLASYASGRASEERARGAGLGAYQHTFCSHLKPRFKQKFIPFICSAPTRLQNCQADIFDKYFKSWIFSLNFKFLGHLRGLKMTISEFLILYG